MSLNTVQNIIKDYESKGMINPNTALSALQMNETQAAHTIATKELINNINILVLAHVEGEQIARNTITQPETLIVELYYEKYASESHENDIKYRNPIQLKHKAAMVKQYLITK